MKTNIILVRTTAKSGINPFGDGNKYKVSIEGFRMAGKIWGLIDHANIKEEARRTAIYR